MKSITVAICILIAIILFLSVASGYLNAAICHAQNVINPLYNQEIQFKKAITDLEELSSYFKSRNNFLMVYIQRSNLSELESIINKMIYSLKTENIALLNVLLLQFSSLLDSLGESNVNISCKGIL
ncbi:MAG: hypothetical protein IJO74_03070 [Clostridia bacterium]|nr:hypothetical protein [Clostridia bacterium]